LKYLKNIMSLTRNQVNKFLSEIDITDKTVLDVGAGEEKCWAIKKTKGIPKRYITVDVEQKDVDIVTVKVATSVSATAQR